MKTIMIDLDDTIVTGGYLDIVNEYLKESHTFDEIKGYRAEKLLPNGITPDYIDYFYNHNVYHYTKVLDDAKEVLEKISKKYDICICSAYLFPEGIEKSHLHISNKYQYLIKEFPFLKPENFIFTSRKDLVSCDIKIDDNLNNLKGNGEKLLYTAYHNQNIQEEELNKLGVKRVNSWIEIEKYLLGE